MTSKLATAIVKLLPADGSAISNAKLREQLEASLGREVSIDDYEKARDRLIADKVLEKGRGRGGSVRRIVIDDDSSFALQQVDVRDSTSAPTPKRRKSKGKSRKRSASPDSEVISYRHQDKRRNNPPVGLVTPETDPAQPATRYSWDPHIDPALQFDVGREAIERLIDDALASGDETAMRTALEDLKRLSDPYLNWTGKAERTSFEVDTVSLHVHERIDPASILAAARKQVKEAEAGAPHQADWLTAPFENLPLRDAIDFYRHERGWSNRMIAGDSLLVMNSLLQKEGMAGQVQMIYIDPPYGIKYGSNFQPFVSKREVSDGKDQDLTQEPEMIKAFRDTWELGIHSYLTYLRDRLLLAKELLHESGSVFVQISDENLHHVREVMDEIFGASNFIALVTFSKTTGTTGEFLAGTADYLLFYGKRRGQTKYRQIFNTKEVGGDGSSMYVNVELENGARRRMTVKEREAPVSLPIDSKFFRLSDITSPRVREGRTGYFEIKILGMSFFPRKGEWKTHSDGMARLCKAHRLTTAGNSPAFVRYIEDFAAFPISNLWGAVAGAADKFYVVQTAPKVIERCLLMTTDPGDLVIDPTCGSGTTAFVAEKWGRRWITCDTSRVAVTLAKQLLMTASYDYYELKYPHEGLKSGFSYKTVPHVTLKSIANNPEIDEVWERMHLVIEPALADLNEHLRRNAAPPFKVTEGGRKGKTVDFKAPVSRTVTLPSGEDAPAGALLEWEVPFNFPGDWPEASREAFDAFHAACAAMQNRMDDSIAAHADQETLYDQPAAAKNKLRISGPFTVEAVPSPTVMSLDFDQPEASRVSEADASIARSGESARQHLLRDELFKTGIRGRGGQVLRFAELESLASGEGSRYLHCTGTLADTGERVVVSFGPQYALLEQRQVALALNDAEKLRPKPRFIVFAAFEFDPEAAKDIDETNWPGVTLLKAKMNADLLTEDLKKKRASNQSFWLMGQPDVELRRVKRPQGARGSDAGTDGDWYEVEVHGFDYFDTAKGDLVSGGKGKIAVWMLDTDYDERSLYPRQVFFPMAGAKDGWHRLKKTIRAELDEDALEQFHGTVSLPFRAGEYRKVAIKIVDDRGIESLKIVSLD